MQIDEKARIAAADAIWNEFLYHADTVACGDRFQTPDAAMARRISDIAIAAYLSALGEQKPVASVDQPELLTIAYMQGAYNAVKGGGKFRFPLKSRVTKTKGSSWTGPIVGFYSTNLTPIGYAVESENEPGSVQIYPEAALEAAGGRG